jgi:hypothetical protein
MKSFLVTLLIWGSLFAGLAYGFHEFYLPPGDLIGAGLLSFFLTLGIGSLRKARMEGGDAALLAEPEGPPRDGERVAIGGTIELTGPPLRAPLSGVECVAYDYSISHWVPGSTGRERGSDRIDRSGMALAPSQVRTSLRSVRLLAYPGLEGFPSSGLEHAGTVERARRYIEATTFQDQSSLLAVGEVAGLMADRTGNVRKDWKVTSHDDLENARFSERVLPVGAKACVIGRYSAGENAIVPEANTGGVRIIAGSRAEALASVRGSRVAGLLVGALMIVLPTAAIWGVLAYREHYFEVNHQPTAMSERSEALMEAAKNGDGEGVRSILRHRVDVNGFDANGQPPLARARDTRIAAELLDAGANVDLPDREGYTPLMRAASEGRADVVRALISRHANVDAKHSGDGETALGLAAANGREEIVAALKEAGAHEPR